MPTPLPSLSTPPGVAAPSKSALNTSLGAGPEGQANAAESKGGFARALEQAASSDAAADKAAPQGEEAAHTRPDGAHHEPPARQNGMTKAPQARSAVAARLEKGPITSTPLAQGVTLGSGLAGEPVVLDPASAAPSRTEDGASADQASPEAGAVGALLSQLQAAAANQPSPTAGGTPAAPSGAPKAGRNERELLATDGPGARRAAAAVRSESTRLASSGSKTDALDTGPTLASPAQAYGSLSVVALDQAVAAHSNLERASAASSQAAPAAPSSPSIAGLGVAAQPAPLGSAGTSPAAGEAHLAASPGSPEFGPQLGAQITTFVRDGLEHARLQLHPADMGPVLVQIQLDGQTAQVHLSAEHALTRQALEEAMPQLASQLQEAGLTLSGGGVSEQAQQGRQAPPDTPAGRTSSAAAPTAPAAPEARQPTARRGVVDLVA